MVKYELLHMPLGWQKVWLKEIMDGTIHYIADEKKAQEYYEDEEKNVEKLLKKWGYEFSKVGSSEQRPKSTKKKKGDE